MIERIKTPAASARERELKEAETLLQTEEFKQTIGEQLQLEKANFTEINAADAVEVVRLRVEQISQMIVSHFTSLNNLPVNLNIRLWLKDMFNLATVADKPGRGDRIRYIGADELIEAKITELSGVYEALVERQES